LASKKNGSIDMLRVHSKLLSAKTTKNMTKEQMKIMTKNNRSLKYTQGTKRDWSKYRSMNNQRVAAKIKMQKEIQVHQVKRIKMVATSTEVTAN